MARSARVITPGPQMDPEKPGVDHLVEVGRLCLSGVTGISGVELDLWAQGDPFHDVRPPGHEGVGVLCVEGPA